MVVVHERMVQQPGGDTFVVLREEPYLRPRLVDRRRMTQLYGHLVLPNGMFAEAGNNEIVRVITEPPDVIGKHVKELTGIDRAATRHPRAVRGRSWVDAPFRQRHVKVCVVVSRQENSQEQVVVLVAAQPLVEAVDRCEGLSADQRRGRQDVHVLTDTIPDMPLGMPGGKIVEKRTGHQGTVLVDLIQIRIRPPHWWRLLPLERLHEFLQVVLIPDIVLVQERDHLAPGLPYPKVSSR